MTAPAALALSDDRAVLEALPVGVALYDEDRRLLFANSVLTRLMGLSPGALRPLSSLSEHLRLMAHHGLLGPGEPEGQVHAVLAGDAGQERRFRRRHPDGRTFESQHIPLASGGLMVCLTDTTLLMSRLDAAESTAGRLHRSVAGLRVGLAVFTPQDRLEAHNPRFLELLGLPPEPLPAGMTTDQLLAALHARGEFQQVDAAVLGTDTGPAELRQQRATGQIVDLHRTQLADGGWTLTVSDVTPMVRAEDEAVRRAALLDSVLEHMPHGIAVFGADRRLMMVNDAYRRIMAGAPGQVGDTLDEVVRARLEAGEYLESDPEAYAQRILAVADGAPFVRRRQRPDGTTIEVRSAALPNGGDITVITDVTALAAAERELASKAELLSNIVDHVPYGVSVYGPDRRLRLVNAAYRSIMEGADIALGETIDEIIERRAKAGEYGPGNPEDRALAQRQHDRTRPQYRRRQRPNGTMIDVRTAPLPDGSHVSVVADVTPLLAAKAELAQRAETMDAMLAHIRHGIILWDRDSRIIAANPVAATLLNAPPGLLVPGRTLAEVTQSALERGNLGGGPAAEQRAVRLMEQDRSRSHIDQRPTQDGRVLEVRSDPTSGGGFVTTYTDVTQVRQAEDALMVAKSAAEAANAAKSRFLAAMSHELRTPLATIIEQAGLIARDAADQMAPRRTAADPARTAEAAETVGSAARTLLGLIDVILDVARLEAGRFDLSDDVVDLSRLLRAVLRRFDATAAAAELALVVDLPEHLPAVRADERRLREALCNIVSNAVKYTGPAGSVTIGIRQDWASGSLLIQVTDTGRGMTEAELERAFEPFVPSDGQFSGAGLGLYVSRTLMRAHGGDLTLRSQPGRGTAATLHIPPERVLQDGPGDTN